MMGIDNGYNPSPSIILREANWDNPCDEDWDTVIGAAVDIALKEERNRIAAIIKEHLGVFPAERLIKAINEDV